MTGTEDLQVPVTSHPKLPEGVPLVADFNDDRNRLSYYYPLLREIPDVRVPLTTFLPVQGDFDSYPDIEYRDITRFMQDLSLRQAFVRGDYSSGKYDGYTGSRIDSQDPYDIETVVLEMLRQLGRGKRHLGSRIAVREWIPHDVEVRYFFRDDEVLYCDSMDDPDEYPDRQARQVLKTFHHFAWSVDFIQHEKTGEWYCIDMGLDGLYHSGTEWIAISEHLDKTHSPEQHIDDIPEPRQFTDNW